MMNFCFRCVQNLISCLFYTNIEFSVLTAPKCGVEVTDLFNNFSAVTGERYVIDISLIFEDLVLGKDISASHEPREGNTGYLSDKILFRR